VFLEPAVATRLRKLVYRYMAINRVEHFLMPFNKEKKNWSVAMLLNVWSYQGSYAFTKHEECNY